MEDQPYFCQKHLKTVKRTKQPLSIIKTTKKKETLVEKDDFKAADYFDRVQEELRLQIPPKKQTTQTATSESGLSVNGTSSAYVSVKAKLGDHFILLPERIELLLKGKLSLLENWRLPTRTSHRFFCCCPIQTQATAWNCRPEGTFAASDMLKAPFQNRWAPGQRFRPCWGYKNIRSMTDTHTYSVKTLSSKPCLCSLETKGLVWWSHNNKKINAMIVKHKARKV